MRRAVKFEGYDAEPLPLEERERLEEEAYWAACEKCDNHYNE